MEDGPGSLENLVAQLDTRFKIALEHGRNLPADELFRLLEPSCDNFTPVDDNRPAHLALQLKYVTTVLFPLLSTDEHADLA